MKQQSSLPPASTERMELLTAFEQAMAIAEFSPDGRVLRANGKYRQQLKRIAQIATDVSAKAEQKEAERQRCRLLTLEREESHNRIRQSAFYDALTGLPNRSLLLVQADLAMYQAKANGRGQFSFSARS